MEIQLATDEQDLWRLAPVLCQLRSAFTPEELVPRLIEQQKDGYQLAFGVDEAAVNVVAGFVIGTKLAWGRHLYVDDLVADKNHRSGGAGQAMLAWLEAYARAQGCGEVHLDSGVQRFGAHRFYLRAGFDIASHHFAKKL